MKKQIALASLNEMPQDFELDELVERLFVLDKIEKGRNDVENGIFFLHEQAKSKLDKWLK